MGIPVPGQPLKSATFFGKGNHAGAAALAQNGDMSGIPRSCVSPSKCARLRGAEAEESGEPGCAAGISWKSI